MRFEPSEKKENTVFREAGIVVAASKRCSDIQLLVLKRYVASNLLDQSKCENKFRNCWYGRASLSPKQFFENCLRDGAKRKIFFGPALVERLKCGFDL